MTRNFSNSNVVASSSIDVEAVFILTFQALYSVIVEFCVIKDCVYFVVDLTVACATASCEKRYVYICVCFYEMRQVN